MISGMGAEWEQLKIYIKETEREIANCFNSRNIDNYI